MYLFSNLQQLTAKQIKAVCFVSVSSKNGNRRNDNIQNDGECDMLKYNVKEYQTRGGKMYAHSALALYAFCRTACPSKCAPYHGPLPSTKFVQNAVKYRAHM